MNRRSFFSSIGGFLAAAICAKFLSARPEPEWPWEVEKIEYGFADLRDGVADVTVTYTLKTPRTNESAVELLARIANNTVDSPHVQL